MGRLFNKTVSVTETLFKRVVYKCFASLSVVQTIRIFPYLFSSVWNAAVAMGSVVWSHRRGQVSGECRGRCYLH